MDNVPPRKTPWKLTQESFDGLLAWLDSDPELAGKKYLEIRSKLASGFARHGCKEPDTLADLTIDRVVKKLPEIVETYTGDKIRYFYRCAHFVRLEYTRDESNVGPLPPYDLPAPDPDENVEPESECLGQCLRKLPTPSRDLFLQYYQGEKRKKIERRIAMAQRLKITQSNLRLRAYRIRANIKECILKCLEQSAV